MISTRLLAVLRKTLNAAALLLVLILLASTCFAQQLTGTLSATVSDSAGAVVPNAKVTMKNEASGDVRPCFFHPAIGNIHQAALTDIINSPEALSFRANLDVATNEICKKCVCSLYVSQ